MMGDGSVIPDGLKTTPLTTPSMLSKNNFKLLVGTVLAMYYPDEDKNLSKKVIEYDVNVFESNENGSVNVHTYFRCRAADLFGSNSDSLEYTYRPQSNQSPDPANTNGSLVLVLCINGITEAGSAVVIGGLQTLQRQVISDSSDGHFYDFNFNGIRQFIDKDGAFSIEFNSAINNDGKQANSAAAGTIISIDKNGVVSIKDNENQAITIDRTAKTISIGNGADSMVIDKGSKSVTTTSSGELTEKSAKAMTVKSGDTLNMESSKDMTIKSGSNLNVETQANGSLKTSASWNIKAGANVNIKAGAMAVIEGGSIAQLKGTLTMLGAGSVPAAGVGISQCMGVGNLGAPVISTIITGSATVFIGT